VQADLRRAQVPEERIQAVIDGKADLTKDQAQRLLQVSLPRYETQVKEVANATSPGLYDRMTPQQKAVMLDVAWQVGSTDQFKKAWAALASGDMASFTNETKVFFTDRSGEKKEDTRRNNLRASMLSGLSHWEATVSKFGSLPSNKLQAAEVASN
jgi:GH24 family phage-related lysozyme (muramidase)